MATFNRVSLVFLFTCLVNAAWSSNFKDILLPYEGGHHGPRHSHEYVRSIQRDEQRTYEAIHTETNIPSPRIKSHDFIDDVYSFFSFDTQHVYGHLTSVEDPLNTVSILEPLHPGGCNVSLLSTVADTARNGSCYVAENAGFFNTENGKCYGNVVSDGRLVRSTNVQNANFGIRKNGTIVVGYVTEEEVLDEDNPFVQLVSGVIWLVRNGRSYVKESIKAESDKHEETGTMKKFVEVKSARTAVGYDKKGNVMMIQVEGQTNARGVNLYDFAAMLIKHGFYNAINLDGGGSSTTTIDGVTVGYPSDHCHNDPAFRCARPVSTIVCAHYPYCAPKDCKRHGTCVDGRCVCQEGWTGDACDIVSCKHLNNCSSNGECTLNGCKCNPGWTGEYCEKSCPAMTFGVNCNQTCSCKNEAECNPVTGSCFCSDGWMGASCDAECPIGFYGKLCLKKCRCDRQCSCDPITGICEEDSARCNRLEIQCHMMSGMLECSGWKMGFFGLLGALVASILSVMYLFLMIKRQPKTKTLRQFKVKRIDSDDDDDESFLMTHKSTPNTTDDEQKNY